MKFVNFYLFFWAIFALLDLDPDSTDLIESGSETLSTTLVITCWALFGACAEITINTFY
jgi:hypothetical protein